MGRGRGERGGSDQLITLLHWGREIYFGQAHFDGQRQCIDGMLVAFKRNKLTKLGRCDRETIEWANNSNDSIVRTAGRVSK